MLIHETTSLCPQCKNAIAARVVERDGEAWMDKACDAHGAFSVRLSDDAAWYTATRAIRPRALAPTGRRPIDRGCPFDCGPCEQHEADVKLPVVTITSACNLDCPICYVHNKNEDAFHMSADELDAILVHLVDKRQGELDIINLTGGDPTLHPHLFDLLDRCQARGVTRVTVCSNGVRLAHDERYVEKLAAYGARIALSFDSFDDATDVALQGVPLLDIKRRCIENCAKYGVDVTLIPVVTRGHNDHELGAIVDLALGSPAVRHLELHTITYTGQGGVSFDPERKGRISMHEVLTCLDEQAGFSKDAFVPSPSAHPLCYQIAYLLRIEDPSRGVAWRPLAEILGRDTFYEALGEHLYLEPSPFLEKALRGAIDRLWLDDDTTTLAGLKALLDAMFPTGARHTHEEAMRAGEQLIKAIYIHSHMDEETFDTERLALCCDSNCYADGTTIPVCAYNVLYREKEARFMSEPLPWSARTGGAQPVAKNAGHPALPVLR